MAGLNEDLAKKSSTEKKDTTYPTGEEIKKSKASDTGIARTSEMLLPL